jgi:hypothetical protein
VPDFEQAGPWRDGPGSSNLRGLGDVSQAKKLRRNARDQRRSDLDQLTRQKWHFALGREGNVTPGTLIPEIIAHLQAIVGIDRFVVPRESQLEPARDLVISRNENLRSAASPGLVPAKYSSRFVTPSKSASSDRPSCSAGTLPPATLAAIQES